MVDLDFLATIQIFSFFTRPELEAAEKLFKEVSFDKDDVVIRIGETGKRIAIASGKLETAYRASSSVPMVMTPIEVGEHVLVDGGGADAARRALPAIEKAIDARIAPIRRAAPGAPTAAGS